MGKFVQFEIDVENLTLNLREQIRRARLCVTDEFPTPLGRLVVSGMEWLGGWVRADLAENKIISVREPFNDEPIINYLPGRRVDLVQAVHVSLSSLEQLKQAGTGRPDVAQALHLRLVFTLRIHAFEDDVSLVISGHDIEGLPEGVPGVHQLRAQLLKQIPRRSVPLDIGEFSTLGGKPRVANADVVAVVDNDMGHAEGSQYPEPVGPGRSRIAIRVELGNYPTSADQWDAFFKAADSAMYRAPGLGGFFPSPRGWTVFCDEWFLVASTVRAVEQELKKSGKFQLQGGIAATWSASDERPLMHLSFYGKALDICGPAGSMRLKVGIPIRLSVPPPTDEPPGHQPGSVQRHVRINYDKNDLDTAKCVLFMGAVWPYLGPKLMSDEALGWSELALSFALPPLITFYSLKELNKGGRAPGAGANCVRTAPDKDEFICTKPFGAGELGLDGGLPQLRDLRSRADGLLLMGDVHWTRRLGRGLRLASVESNGFELKNPPGLPCTQAGSTGLALVRQHPDWFVRYEAGVSFDFEPEPLSSDNQSKPVGTNPNDIIPAHICTARIRPEDDPLGVFTPYLSWSDTGSTASVGVDVPVSSIPDAYFTDEYHYPCRVLIFTSDGVRLVTLPPIDKAPDDEIASLATAGWAKRVNDCYLRYQKKNPKWIIDPPDRYSERHHWAMRVTQLKAGEEVRLQDRVGRTVAAAHADGQGEARLGVLLEPQAYDGQLALRRGRDIEAGAVQQVHTPTDIKQTQLLLRSELLCPDGPVEVTSLAVGDRPAIAVLTLSGVDLYGLGQVHRPDLLSSTPLAGLAGILGTQDQIVAWGTEGLSALHLDGEAGQAEEIRVEQLSDGPVDGVAEFGSEVFVLQQGQVNVRVDDRIEPVLDVPGAHLLAATARHLLLGSADAVTLYERPSDYRWPLRAAAERSFEHLSAIRTSDVLADDSSQFLLENSSRSELIDASQPQSPVVVGTYEQVPELATFSSHRDIVAERDPTANAVRLYTVGATVSL
ncbi:hypothetical protein [Streptomyces qinglanensis]|uniref:hypothetical protein n=1 Tax=Streptomyces qinglanensis TaxID=943816 RepID=UPI00378B1757